MGPFGLVLSRVVRQGWRAVMQHFQEIRAKHELLLSAPPAATFDCGALYDPLMLLSALEHASSSPAATAVKKIVASRNQLSRAHIPALLPLLLKFTMLVEVDFSHNVLEDNDVCQVVGALACIRTIAVVSFEHNFCGPCPQVVKSAAWSSCKLAPPTDEIISGGWNSVAKFLKQKEFKLVHKTRLMFIGRGVSGKTRLVRALLQGSAASIDVQTGRTIGIDLSRQLLRLPGKGNEPAIEAVPWDFAGQELSYLSHSVHLSARCVYVLVWSPRKEMEESSRDSVDGIVQPMLEWLQILSSHVPDASIVLVGTHSKTPEGKDKPGVFRDGAYAEEYAKLAEEVQRKVTEEINRLNCIVEQELVHLQRRVLPLVSTRLGAATQLLQELQTCAHVAPSSPSVSSQQPMSPSLQPPISNPLQQSHLHHRQLLLQQSSDVSAPHELRRCAEEVLYLERLEAATQERMRRLCGVRDGSKPREDAVAVKMRMMMTSQVDSSNQSGIPELKEELSFCCRGLRFVGESVPMSWIRVEEAIDELQQQSLTVSEACREILKLMQTELQGSSSVAKTPLNESDIEEALEFWSQLGRVFMQDGQLFPKPQLVVDLIRPLVHHKPMNLLYNTERLGLLKEPSLQSGALYDEARQHLQVLEARNEVHEDFLAKHVTSWSQLSEQQARVMLNFFVACALLSEIENRRGTYLVTARLRNLPSVQQLATPAADISASAVLSSAGDLSSEMRERLEISAAREDMMRSIQQSLQTFMQPAHCAAQVIPLVLGTTHVSDREVSPSLCVRANEAFFLLPIRHIAVLARLQARMVQAQPRGISVNMHMFSDGVVISRGKSLCAAVVRCWSPSERSPKLRDRVVNLDCVLHLVSNDDGMFRFMSRCIEGIIETAFAGLRYECWCPVRDQHGNTVDWMQFDGGSAHAVAQSLSSTLEDKNIFDVIFDRQQLHQLFALCCPIFISHTWNDGTFLFVKRLKRHIETQALVSVWCDYLQLDQQQGAVEVKFREGLCKASVILVCLTPRYLTRPNCLRELQWALDFAYKAEKDVRILPLHPALTFAGIQAIAQHGCVCVSNADGTHKVHRLSAKAVELVVKLKQYMCLSWSDLQPWASDALGESWPEHALAADGSVISMVTGDGGRPVGLVDELVSKIADKLGFNDRPSKVGDCKEMEDKDLEASAVADADVPANLLDSYPEISPAFRQRVQDCSDRNKRVADAILRHRGASSALAAGASAVPQPPPAAPAPPVAPSSAVDSINIQGIFVKTKSHAFPALSKSTRFIIFDAEGIKRFELSGGVAGRLRGELKWTQVRGAARVGEWNGRFGVEVLHPGVKGDVSIFWCDTEVQRDEIVTAINSRK